MALVDDAILILKGKKLPTGHVTTRKDGSQWRKQKDQKGGKSNWVMVKPAPKAKTTKEPKKKKDVPIPERKWKNEADLFDAVEAVLTDIQSLDRDQASVINEMGFNKFDGPIARKLLSLNPSDWSIGQKYLALKLANKYRGQHGEHGFKSYLAEYEEKSKKATQKKDEEIKKLEEKAIRSIKDAYPITELSKEELGRLDGRGHDGSESLPTGDDGLGGDRGGADGLGADTSGPGVSRIFGYDSERYGKDKILIARAAFTAIPQSHFLSERLAPTLKEHQRDFINLAMEKFGLGERGILNFDGTGAGKTRQELGLAQTFMDQNPTAKVLIVTQSKRIIDDAFIKDGLAMGVRFKPVERSSELPSKGISVTSYSSLKGLESSFDDFNLVLFDESHSMKNSDSVRSKLGAKLMAGPTKKIALFTATPVDKAKHFEPLCDTIGLDKAKVYQYLGYEKSGKDYRTNHSIETVMGRIDALMGEITKSGLAVKREVPLNNLETTIQNIEFDEAFRDEYNKAAAHIEEKMRRNRKYSGTGKMQKNRLAERAKIKSVIKLAKEDLAQGRQVVIFAGTCNGATFGTLDKKSGEEDEAYIEGTLKIISDRLNKEGISHSKVFGGSSTKKAREAVQGQIRDFQSGKNKVIIATPESGGTGISLDDTEGNSPRKMYILTPPFSSVDFIQEIGRINRLTTKSKAEATILNLNTDSDHWTLGIIAKKIQMLGGTVKGDYADLSVREMEILGSLDVDERAEYARKLQEKRRLQGAEDIPSQEGASDPRLADLDINYFKGTSTKVWKNREDKPEKPTRPKEFRSTITNLSQLRDNFDTMGKLHDVKVNFGKHRFMLSEIRDKMPGYFEWMMQTAGIKATREEKIEKSFLTAQSLRYKIAMLQNQTAILKSKMIGIRHGKR